MKNNKIRLTESQLHRVIKECVREILREEYTQKYVKGGNQQYAKEEQLSSDMQKIPEYYETLMNDGKVYVMYCDDAFYEFLQEKGIKFTVRTCADYYERTLFTLVA